MDAGRRDIIKAAASATLAACVRRGTVRPSEAAPSAGSKGRGAMRARHLLTLRLETAPIQEIGAVPHGNRTTFPISGGSFEGDRLRGKVLPGGDDWTIKRADGVIEVDLRITLATEDGALIHMTFEGIRDDGAPGGAYFRHVSRFETAAGPYAFLNRLLAVGAGQLGAGGPVHVIDEIL